jgi:hypothetical protein
VLDSGVYNGAGSTQNTRGAVVTITTASGRTSSPVETGFAPEAMALAPVAAPHAAAAGAGAAVTNVALSSAVKRALIGAFATAHGVTVAQVGGIFPSPLFYAYDGQTHTYWVVASFYPARGDTLAVQVSFQDAGGFAILSRGAGAAWRFRGNGLPIDCTEVKVVPAAVLALWHVPAKPPGCPAG